MNRKDKAYLLPYLRLQCLVSENKEGFAIKKKAH